MAWSRRIAAVKLTSALFDRFRLRLHAALDDGQLRHADAERLADLRFDLRGEVAVLVQEPFGVFAALADADVPVGEPRARLLDDAVLEADVDQLAPLRDAFAVGDIELRLAERCGALVLDDLHLHARSDDFFAFLDLRGAADVDAHRGVELECASASGGLRIAEHHADLFANLVDEDQTGPRLRYDTGELAQRLRHQPRLQAHLHVAHLPFELGARNQRGDGVDDDHVDRSGAHER